MYFPHSKIFVTSHFYSSTVATCHSIRRKALGKDRWSVWGKKGFQPV